MPTPPPDNRPCQVASALSTLAALGLLAVVVLRTPDAHDVTHGVLAVVAAAAVLGFVRQSRSTQRHLRANEQRLAAQGRALMELTARQMERAASVEERLGWILETCARTLDAGRVSIWRFDDAGASIKCLDLFDQAAGTHSSGDTIRRDDYPSYFRALEQERFIAAEDAAHDRRTREFTASYLTPHGIGSMLDVPLRRRDEVNGVLCVEHVGGARTWTADERNFVLAVANLIVAAVATDERREALRRLAIAKGAAEEATRAKSEFLANMSHELRTPLNGVLGYAQLLQRDRSLAPRHTEALDAIARCGTHLLDLINDVLDLSKIEAGRVEIEAAPCDVRGVAADVRQIVAARAREKGLGLDVEVAADVPGRVVVDGPHLRQVLLNLLGNAVKFTERGRVTLTIARRGRGLVFEVADTGVGIEAESLDEIFRAFRQTRAGARAGGTGLGLTISARLVRSMGGELNVESRVGQGSRFRFELPVEEGTAPRFDAPDRWIGVRLAPGSAATALVVDDNSVNRRLLAALLESAGIQAMTANGGQEAIDLVVQHRPDVVLMDLRMPDVDGLEVTRRLRASGLLATSPVIAVTASAFDDTRAAALDAGCAGVLTKPIRAGQLFSMLADLASIALVWPPDAPAVEGEGEGAAEAGAAIPAGAGTRLRQAAAAGNIAGVEAVVRELRLATGPQDPLVSQIAKLADVFDYDTLMELAETLDRQPGGACAAHS